MIYMISVFAFLFTVLTLAGLYYCYEDRKSSERERLLSRFIPRQEAADARGRLFKKRGTEGRLYDIFSGFAGVSRLKEMLLLANINLSVGGFMLISLGCAVILVIAGVFILDNAILNLFLLPSGFAVPFLYLLYRKNKRAADVIKQLPDVVELMVRSLRSGQSLDKALQEVDSHFSEPLGREVGKMREENAMGVPFESAMRNFEGRLPRLADIKIFCTSLIIQRKTGGNLTEILEGLSNTIRERVKLEREVKALTAEGRVSMIVLASLPFAFGAVNYLLNPEYIKLLFVHPAGRQLLVLAMVFEAAGFAVMRLLTRIEV